MVNIAIDDDDSDALVDIEDEGAENEEQPCGASRSSKLTSVAYALAVHAGEGPRRSCNFPGTWLHCRGHAAEPPMKINNDRTMDAASKIKHKID